jgi:Acetyltransferases
MPHTLDVRFVRPSDFDGWLPLWDGYNAFYGRSGPTALDPAVTRTTWARFFDPYEPVHGLVAEREGRIVGLAHYLLHRSTSAIEPRLYLQDLFTAADARGGGIGRALIDAVCDRAREMAIARIYWNTHETNAVARRLYDKVAENSGFLMYRKEV